MTVAVVLREKGAAVIAVGPDARVAEVADIITRRRIGAVVVEDGQGDLVGIVSERDVVRGLTEFGAALMDMPVSSLMTHAVKTVTPQTSVMEATEIMDEGYFRHLPVRGADGRLCGIVSIRDLVRYRLHAQQSDVESLQAYVIGRGYALGRV